MLRRDYLLKLIQDMFAAIARLLEKENDESEKQKEIEALYATFGKDKDFFRNADLDEIITAIANNAAEANGGMPDQVSPDEMTQRTELLAALMYADFKVSELSPGLRKDIAHRAAQLYQMVDDSSDTFSFERRNRIRELLNAI